ncbi:MAG TPA: ABC transporter ATP-binding protein [Clostridiaceae bacterium]|nr:ABC transporter ATP-binding protein [Clostridiaceae bacterium]
MKSSLIRCEDLSFGYDARRVVGDLNFSINQGDYLAIVGENGSGKTTLLKGLLNLIKPLSGQVIMGQGLEYKNIGYLPQQSQVQRGFPASVKEVVLSGCLNRTAFIPRYSKQDRRRAKNQMERMGILKLSQSSYRDLSGGQQQRVLLARALCAADRMMIMDEPASGLDPLVSHELYALIRELNKEDNMTIIIVSHDIHCVLRDASHVLHLKGEQLFYGSREDYIDSEYSHYLLAGHTECVVAEN